MEAIVLLRAHAVQGFRESCLDAARQINCTLRFRPTANETAKKESLGSFAETAAITSHTADSLKQFPAACVFEE